MKYFGFIIEHGNEDYSSSVKNLILDENIENTSRIEVIKYLKKGELCVAWMGFVENAMNPSFNDENFEDNDFMGFTSVYTDGQWYWPDYIVNYLEKYPTMKIDDEFVEHVINNKSKEIKLSEKEISKLEKEYLDQASFKK